MLGGRGEACRLIVEQRTKQLVVHRVSGAIALDMGQQRCAREAEVANAIERLVACKFGVIAQAFLIEEAVLADHDGVVERAAQRQSGGAHFLDVGGEAEGARVAQLVDERGVARIIVERLRSDRMMIEGDFAMQREMVCR